MRKSVWRVRRTQSFKGAKGAVSRLHVVLAGMMSWPSRRSRELLVPGLQYSFGGGDLCRIILLAIAENRSF